MKTRYHLPLAIVILLFVSWVSLQAQGIIPQAKQEATAQVESDSVKILPFKVTAITEAFDESNSLITGSGSVMLTGEEIAFYKEEVDTLIGQIDLFFGDSSTVSLARANVRELNQIMQRSTHFIGELEELQNRLEGQTRNYEELILNLTLYKKRWLLTLDSQSGEEVLQERLVRIDRTIARLDSVKGLLQNDMGSMLLIQDRLSDKKNGLELLEEKVKNQKTLLGEQMLSKDMPGFFSELSSLKDSTLMSKHFNQMKRSVRADLEIFKADFLSPMIFFSVLFVLFLIFAIWYKRHFASMMSVSKFELSEMHMELIYSPGVSVVFILAILIRFIYPDLPQTFASLNLLIMLVPMMIIVIRLFGSVIKKWIMVLVIVFGLTFFYELFYYPDILLRIVLLAFSITGLWLFISFYVKRPLSSKFGSSFMYRLFRMIILFFSILLFLSVIANLAGAFNLAEFFTLIPIQLAVVALGIHVITKVVDTLFFLLLASNYMQKFNVIRDEFDVIYRKSVRLIDTLLWIFFFTLALRIFRVRDTVFEWGRGVFTNGIELGEVNITLGNILIFIFVVWLSIVITRMLSHILEKDVFPRVKTSKGVPSTIILLMRIVLISGGFFLAAKAAGMALTNLSIVLGAFSVGIGFGLQNIFNNMVSGLILAFERPIKVGDVVQVGELIGTVRSIGLRSSTVRSFDGAEVIVPNGNLISNEMINWTLSDSNRRMDIRIGVAYGTDPELVVSILEGIAAEHSKVRKQPAPKAYFIGFGDSSLDFRLLAWANLDYRLETESELNVELNRKLKEAGIEIPFPQTDLHVRSDDTKIQGRPD